MYSILAECREWSDRNGVRILLRERRWWEPLQTGVWASVVIGVTPTGYDTLSFGQRCEFLAREALVSKTTVEALHKSVLPWAARLNETCPDIDLTKKGLNSTADEFRPVVTSEECGYSS